MILPILFAAPKPILVVHYMPWFQAKPARPWGWHWTMDKTNPDHLVNGQPDIATHYHPLIGPYDSEDQAVLEYQAQLMKLAGIDGVLIDWYGNVDCDDYLLNHQATRRFISVAEKAGLKFGIVYEDRTVTTLISKGKATPDAAVAAGNTLMKWVDRNWFSSPDYLTLNGKPVMLVFGPEYYKNEAWNDVFDGLSHPPSFFTLDSVQAPGAGTFGWPQPGANWKQNLSAYYGRGAKAPVQIAPAFPRFNDFYHDAGVGAGYGEIPDDGGRTYTWSLEQALGSGSPIIQLVTWNDYGEGTVLEPTTEFGYRDLEATQAFVRSHWNSGLPYTKSDLRLPVRLLQLRRAGKDGSTLDKVSSLLLAGKVAEARRELSQLTS